VPGRKHRTHLEEDGAEVVRMRLAFQGHPRESRVVGRVDGRGAFPTFCRVDRAARVVHDALLRVSPGVLGISLGMNELSNFSVKPCAVLCFGSTRKRSSPRFSSGAAISKRTWPLRWDAMVRPTATPAVRQSPDTRGRQHYLGF
jgi:hypothetical protein